MGVSTSAGPGQPAAARRSIRFRFTTTVAVPTACLALLWMVAAGIAVASDLAPRSAGSTGHQEATELALLVAAGLVVILASLVLMGSFARQVARDAAELAAAARYLADEQLPQVLEQLRTGDQALARVGGSLPPGHSKSAEIAEAVAAVASLQQTAITAAAGEASLRDGLRQVFVSMARRNQSLLQRQLRLIDALEQKAADPAALADLFSLDHLTTRMRRHAESLAILSGAAPGRSWSEPVAVIDVLRRAMAEVEDYRRVTVLTRAEDAVVAPAAADMIHLLAELMENATMFSQSGTRVEVRAERVANGFAIEIDDRGLGIEPGQLSELNQQLARPPDFDLANADRLGLFVGAKLAARHGVRVSLRPSPYGGTTAIVLMPNSLLAPVARTAADPLPGGRRAPDRAARLDLGSAGALALTGRRHAQPPLPPAAQPAATAAGPGPAGQAGTGQPGIAAPDGGTRRSLPHRTRQASLSPHLRGGPAAGSAAADQPGPGASEARTPEQARDLAASLQTGWRLGRQPDTPDAWPAAGTRLSGQQDSAAPQSEEA
ncbi:MAG TPA: ATP-binding protein [Streptosporangiaceae bacterium]|nr:ATP-binding protein [Streptosporangiaceae bacterium]